MGKACNMPGIEDKIDLREIEWDDVDWICMPQEREQWWTFVNTSGFISCWEILEWLNSH
jgi:hypothetical protein